MISLLSCNRAIGAAFLFFFLFSANALFYSVHAVEELGHDHTVKAGLHENRVSAGPATADGANHHHDGDQKSQHGDGHSCCENHSHVSILYQHIDFKHVPHIISQPIIENFRFIPEVYLSKFVPPRIHA